MFERYWPMPSLCHVARLTDSCGIIQHARFWHPYYPTGYCVDDNSRALIAAYHLYKLFGESDAHELAIKYLSFLIYAQRDDGNFHNLVAFDRTFADEKGSPDSLGRAIWALGTLAAVEEEYFAIPSEEMLRHAIPHLSQYDDLNSHAYGLLGLCAFGKNDRWKKNALLWSRPLAESLLAGYKECHSDDWEWFRPILTYGNARLPQALLQAGELLKKTEMVDIGLRTLDFLNGVCFRNEYLSVVGSAGWYPRGKTCAEFDQQPIDAGAMAEANLTAWQLTGKEKYLDYAVKSMDWFYGKNAKAVPLYCEESGGCCDGLHSLGVNLNQGAESTLAHLMAQLCMYKHAPQLFLSATVLVK